MALELLKENYGDLDDDENEGEEQSSFSAEEEQGEISDLRVSEKELACEGVKEEIGMSQMTNGRVIRGNVMSVELAIQRELQYRTKIERLKLRSLAYELEEPPIVVQGSPLNSELGEMSTKSTSNNVSCWQGETSELLFFERKLARDGLREEISIAQMTSERATRTIMSVELAIQRELEYQAKIKRLQRLPRNDYKEAPKPFKGAPSDSETEKTNRKNHSDNVSSSQDGISDPMVFKRELEGEASEEEITGMTRTDERVKRNIMPVELALQRELAYRRKLKCLQSQPSIRFQEPPILFQESSSNLRTEVKRKAPSGNPTCSIPRKFPRYYTQPSPAIESVNLYCKDCQLVCLNESTLKQHYEGDRHKARLEYLKKGRELLVCKVCWISFMPTDKISFKHHLEGKKHAACLQALTHQQ